MASATERPVALPPSLRGSEMSDAIHFRHEAARANRLAQELIDPLTSKRLQDLAADYIRQAIELERGGPIAPPDIDPTG
jgi:hypothetical protein